VIAVLTKEGSPSTSRRPGLLERVYLEAADGVSRMVAEGLFPWRDVPQGEWPRVGDGLFLLDRSGQITWASPNALSALSRLDIRQNAVGSWLDDISPGLTPVAEALAGRRLVDGELVNGGTHVFLRVMPLIEDGHVTGGLVLARDVTELRQKDRVISVKDATIREIHHRVKNNLQTIASLLRLQARRLDSEEGRAALTESVLRVSTIALVHETLSEELTDTVEFGDVAGRIARMAAEGLVLPDRQLEIKVTGSTGGLTADVATPLAVAVTELLQNSIEHGFPYAGTGTVVVELAREKGHAVVVVRDDGVGMPEQAPVGARLGLNIVRTLVAELGGSFEVVVDGGTRTELRVPTSPAR
jgi:two-component sensor histidine kinase